MTGNAGRINMPEMTDNKLIVTNSSATLIVKKMKAFWKLQSTIASILAAKLPGYNDAKLLFQTNDHGEPCVEGEDLVLKSWQVVGVRTPSRCLDRPTRGES
jgi:hypothetical protein